MERARALLPTFSARWPSTWKLLAIIFALINFKTLPFAWHLRLLYGLVRQILTSRYRLTHISPSNPSRPLFAPLIISSRSPPLECDYNLHKSNSTYFSDSDVGRLHVMIATIGKGVDRIRKELEAEDRKLASLGQKKTGDGGGFGVRLGGVSANFRKEIKPFEKFEIWTRILAWDGKWLYLVQHFVKPGAVRPRGYLLQPWRKVWGKKTGVQSAEEDKAGSDGKTKTPSAPPSSSSNSAHSAIFASIIAKYVCKKGRLTIPPERVLRASQLLPPRPVGEGEEELTPPSSTTPSTENASTVDAAAVSVAEKLTPAGAEAIIDSSLTVEDSAGDSGLWDWARVEKERLRGMKIAEVYSKLDGLNDEFRGDGAEVIGKY